MSKELEIGSILTVVESYLRFGENRTGIHKYSTNDILTALKNYTTQPPLSDDVGELLDDIKDHFQSLQTCITYGDIFDLNRESLLLNNRLKQSFQAQASENKDLIEQALRLQPQRTKQEYIDEIIQRLRCQYSEENKMFYQEGEWGINLATNGYTNKIYIDWDNVALSLQEAKLIIDFFTEYGDSE